MRFLLLFVFILLLFSCARPAELKVGTWRGVIGLQGKELPFTFEVEKDSNQYRAYLINDSEKLLLDEIYVHEDSVKMVLHIFDADLRVRIAGDKLTGTYFKNYAPEFSLPFKATFSDNYRFVKNSESEGGVQYSGKYQLEFKTEKDTYPSVGVFEQKGNHVTGTFLTPMGDYRYLEGNVVDDKLMLSTFDGNHAFLFVGEFAQVGIYL